MRKVAAACCAAACCAAAGEGGGWEASAGADLRVRQEVMNNLPGLPGDAYSLTPAARADYRNQYRIRPRVWFALDGGKFRLYTRIADEFRHFPALNAKRHARAYYFPDEVYLDNLYLEGKGLEPGVLEAVGASAVDFRLGRQELLEGGGSIFGLNRIIAEGTPTDGSRGFFADMARARVHFGDERSVDVFAMYNSGRNDLAFGTSGSRARNLNCINMSDSPDLDEWGGGFVWNENALGGDLPFKLYTMFKRSEAYVTERPAPKANPAKEVTLLGFWAEPRLSEAWSLELEGGRQFGRLLDGNKQAGGWMQHTELKYRPDLLKEFDPVVSAAVTYYSGDKHRTGEDDNDTAWDPMWARYTQDSEMLVYGTLYANCWWSNMIYPKAKLTMKFGPRHGCYFYTGPMFAAVQDGLGHADGKGDSTFRGMLTALRYDFPVKLSPGRGSTGWDRFEVFGHVVGELFNPGDYYESSRPAYFVRWQFEFAF